MARDHGRILARIWNDPDFCARTPEAQRLYFLLLSQRTINNAGVLPLMIRKWSRGSEHTSEQDIADALAELCEHGFVAVDEDTEEALVRSFIRNDGVLKQPNVLKSALRQAREIESPKLCHVLAEELRRIALDITVAVADEIDPNPCPKGSEKGSENPSEADREPSENEPFANPSATPAGMGMGWGRGSSPSVGGDLGGRAHAREEATPGEEPSGEQTERPAERCRRHRDLIGDPGPCRACGDARRAAEEWDAEQARSEARARSAEARRRAELRAAEIAACHLCDSSGYIGRRVCNHDPDAEDRAARGRAAVEAALNRKRAP